MYLIDSREDVVRIPPNRLGEEFDKVMKDIACSNAEGKIIPEKGLTVLVSNIKRHGEGRIVHGDGAIYQRITYDALMFRPELHEVVEGNVVEIMKFGAFVRFGPLDGLLHISQLMDDRVDVDSGNQRLLGKDTKRELRVGNRVKARIVAISLNERSPKESKIGLTMRQPGLGRIEWLEEARKPKEEKPEPKPKK